MNKEELTDFYHSNKNQKEALEELSVKSQGVYIRFLNAILTCKLPMILPFYLEPPKGLYEEWQKAFAIQGFLSIRNFFY